MFDITPLQKGMNKQFYDPVFLVVKQPFAAVFEKKPFANVLQNRCS